MSHIDFLKKVRLWCTLASYATPGRWTDGGPPGKLAVTCEADESIVIALPQDSAAGCLPPDIVGDNMAFIASARDAVPAMGAALTAVQSIVILWSALSEELGKQAAKERMRGDVTFAITQSRATTLEDAVATLSGALGIVDQHFKY